MYGEPIGQPVELMPHQGDGISSYAPITGVPKVEHHWLCTLLLSANQYRRSSSCSAARHACLSLSNARFSKKHLGASRSVLRGGGQGSIDKVHCTRRRSVSILDLDYLLLVDPKQFHQSTVQSSNLR